MKMTTKLRKLFQKKKTIVAPGAHDVLTARIIEQTGFDAVYMTGYGTSASVLGRPDVGMLTMTEMVERARNMAEIINVPLIKWELPACKGGDENKFLYLPFVL
ncbi:MAG: isocitrate lyase/phosphoenolpyruvate mutase family protein [Kosmotogaceae bacterium]